MMMYNGNRSGINTTIKQVNTKHLKTRQVRYFDQHSTGFAWSQALKSGILNDDSLS